MYTYTHIYAYIYIYIHIYLIRINFTTELPTVAHAPPSVWHRDNLRAASETKNVYIYKIDLM